MGPLKAPRRSLIRVERWSPRGAPVSPCQRSRQGARRSWNQSGVQKKKRFFGNQFSTFDSPRDFPQRISSDDVQRNREAAPEAEDGQNYGTIPMPMFATRPMTMNSKRPVNIPQNYMVGQQGQQIPKLQFDKFPNPQSFFAWKIWFKTQVTTCSDFPLDAMLWTKEVEMVDSLDELKSSRSVYGKDFPNFEMLDAKIALNKIVHNSLFKKKVSLEEQKAIKRTGFCEEDRSPSWFTTTIEWLALMTQY